jgi:cellulose synthase/poly-beta-1,6-N-acetylglucosamine synthase-like glycosyltransferase
MIALVEGQAWLVAGHLSILAPLGLYGLHRLVTLVRLARASRVPPTRAPLDPGDPDQRERLPRVLVQVPLYNERAVAARVLRAVAALDWPRDRFEIQVLDDSNDGTCEVVDAEVQRLSRTGTRFSVLRREERTGFKAGALAHGLEHARADLVAVFDADFVPAADFLVRVVAEFDDPRVALVQARWGHLDRERNALARAQAVLLDGHFAVEHAARHRSGLWFNFNGTAGIWRTAAIRSAGGWQGDTLTEDLDLSYRAQLAGWRFVYRDDVEVPAELPADLAAFLGQQHRWAKGSIQVLRKLGRRLFGARAPWRCRQEALVHLGANGAYPLVLLLALAMPLSAPAFSREGGWLLLALFLACVGAVATAYWVGGARVGRPRAVRLFEVPLAMALGIGMALQQTRAVLTGLQRASGEFVRTPKRGSGQRLYRSALPRLAGAELVIAGWLCSGIVRSIEQGVPGAVPFQALFAAGFGWVGILALLDRFRARRACTEVTPWTGPAGHGDAPRAAAVPGTPRLGEVRETAQTGLEAR